MCGGRGRVIHAQGPFRVETTCPTCQGAGRVITTPCDKCHGAGRVLETAEIPVEVPKGVDSGMRLRVRGAGESGDAGAPPGDLYVFIEVERHPLLEREGHDLHCVRPISFVEAALGAEVEVASLEGPEKVRVSRGTQNGDQLRVRGKGMPDPRGHGRGDLVVHFQIEVPSKLSERQEELLREFAELDNVQVNPHQKSFFERIRDYFTSPEDQKE